ncbi:unnamed protein product [Vitrella brassicaformis CCMP3155]|uniref:Major facilitator superfamily (MFS) profile domain-containing protein n=1 Tax=Vitrella brassicaformis (strain CCMP3155) TaxID=1169540 RepID=A0A0G4EWE0_VITBC|nr:unnamed protein product [Vitrella brassicaformis CCMP3155]|eukprot:CEM02665.1 unnamed protein product [Vitrella brassicaformis CCMP3155]
MATAQEADDKCTVDIPSVPVTECLPSMAHASSATTWSQPSVWLADIVWPAIRPLQSKRLSLPSTNRRKTQNILNVACALDGADMQLLPSTFRALERELHLGPKDLGQLSLCQSLFQSLSAPVWGFLADRYSRQTVLAYGCILWGVFTIVLAASTRFWEMMSLRALNGMALASVGPLSQSMIADLFSVDERGRAFGWVQASQNTGAILGGVATTTISQMIILGMSGWRVGFIVVGLLSIALGVIISLTSMSIPRHGSAAADEQSGTGRRSAVVRGMARELRKIRNMARKPSFWGVVLQGVFGNVPWNAMAFFTLWYQYVGLQDYQAALAWAAKQAGAGVGGLIGGKIGDSLHSWNGNHGRPLTAQISVLLGMPMTAIVLQVIPRSPDWYIAFLACMFLLGMVASWASVATNRPILSDIVEPADRATIFAWLLAIEGASGSLFGAPSVAFMAEMFFGYEISDLAVKDMTEETRLHNVNALANSLTVAMLLPWAVCFLIYGSLHFTYRHDRLSPNQQSGFPQGGLFKEKQTPMNRGPDDDEEDGPSPVSRHGIVEIASFRSGIAEGGSDDGDALRERDRGVAEGA